MSLFIRSDNGHEFIAEIVRNWIAADFIADSIGAMRFELRKAVEKYNAFRPHHALKGKTLMEYLRINQADVA